MSYEIKYPKITAVNATHLSQILVLGFSFIGSRHLRGGGANGEKWRKMAKNGDGEFGFFICQIRHFSPIFDFGISHLTDFHTANHLETLQSHYWHRYRTNATHIE